MNKQAIAIDPPYRQDRSAGPFTEHASTASSLWAVALVTLVVLLSLAACGLMLLVPTRSISVTTVYKGF
jgi:hypothetical protein